MVGPDQVLHQVMFLLRQPREQLLAIPTKSDCGLTPAWRGIVWTALIDVSGTMFAMPDSIGGK